jgi:hypothetical protein
MTTAKKKVSIATLFQLGILHFFLTRGLLTYQNKFLFTNNDIKEI